jgi:hypothetical protein
MCDVPLDQGRLLNRPHRSSNVPWEMPVSRSPPPHSYADQDVVKEQAMSIPKIAAMFSLTSALSLVAYGPAQSAPLNSLSAVAKPGTEQTNAVQVRWRRGWPYGASAPPSYYGGSYWGYKYGGFPGIYGKNYAYGYRPYGWYWYSPY